MKNNLYLIVSEEDKVIEFNNYIILNKINFDYNDKIIYDGNINSLLDVLDEASTISMFSKIKVIIYNNFNLDNVSDLEYDYLNKFISSKNKDVYLIFNTSKVDQRKKIFKLFKDNFNIIDDDKLSNDMVCNYVSDIITNKGYKCDSFVVQEFVSRVYNDINNINNELDKLFIFKCDSKVIKLEDVELLIVNNIDNIMYEWTNAFLDKDMNKVIMMYNNFRRENISQDYLISSLYGSIRTNLIIKLLKNQGKSNLDIAKFIGKKEYFVKKSLERLYNYRIDDLTDYIVKLSDIDIGIKTGKDNIDRLYLLLINR